MLHNHKQEIELILWIDFMARPQLIFLEFLLVNV